MRGLLNERDVIPRDLSDLPVIAHVVLGITTVIRSCPYFFIISVIGISAPCHDLRSDDAASRERDFLRLRSKA